jgi:hypothetical protein
MVWTWGMGCWHGARLSGHGRAQRAAVDLKSGTWNLDVDGCVCQLVLL